jgi:ABC-type uncharacterized transport system auxiliary subunit
MRSVLVVAVLLAALAGCGRTNHQAQTCEQTWADAIVEARGNVTSAMTIYDRHLGPAGVRRCDDIGG